MELRPNEPNSALLFHDDMSFKGPHTLRKRRGYPHQDARSLFITRLLTMGQIRRKRAVGDLEDAPSATRKRAMVAASHSASAMDKEVI